MQRGIPSSRGSFQSAVLAKIRNAKDLFGKSFSLLVPGGFGVGLTISFWEHTCFWVMRQAVVATKSRGWD